MAYVDLSGSGGGAGSASGGASVVLVALGNVVEAERVHPFGVWGYVMIWSGVGVSVLGLVDKGWWMWRVYGIICLWTFILYVAWWLETYKYLVEL